MSYYLIPWLGTLPDIFLKGLDLANILESFTFLRKKYFFQTQKFLDASMHAIYQVKKSRQPQKVRPKFINGEPCSGLKYFPLLLRSAYLYTWPDPAPCRSRTRSWPRPPCCWWSSTDPWKENVDDPNPFILVESEFGSETLGSEFGISQVIWIRIGAIVLNWPLKQLLRIRIRVFWSNPNLV